MPRRQGRAKQVEALRHDEAKRTNIPTAEYSAALEDDDRSPIEVAYERRNRDLDPQLVWRGKDEQDLSDLVVQAPPLYIQEKVHPKVLIDDLQRRSERDRDEEDQSTEGYQHGLDLFSDFNGLPEDAERTDFYEHDANWSNRMILGDSLQVMASLAEREGLRGKVQCIYIDPPYGIKFNSNFQWSTTSRDVTDGNAAHITREPEQVKAFRDTWRDGIHSYLSYLRDRLEAARDLLADSGSVFVQIGDENVHRVRAVMDEVFGADNLVSKISFVKTSGSSTRYLGNVADYLLWYAKDLGRLKYRGLFEPKRDKTLAEQYRFVEADDGTILRTKDADIADDGEAIRGRRFMADNLTGQGDAGNTEPYTYQGRSFLPTRGRHWSTTHSGLNAMAAAGRLTIVGERLGCVNHQDL